MRGDLMSVSFGQETLLSVSFRLLFSVDSPAPRARSTRRHAYLSSRTSLQYVTLSAQPPPPMMRTTKSFEEALAAM